MEDSADEVRDDFVAARMARKRRTTRCGTTSLFGFHEDVEAMRIPTILAFLKGEGELLMFYDFNSE